MNYRFIIGCLFVLCVSLFTSQSIAVDITSTDPNMAFIRKASKSRPNIVLILADDMGYSDLGCYGGEINTPNLDSLAAGGLRFTQFYNAARCCPTRASLLTGLYPHQADVGHMVYTDEGPGYRGQLNTKCVTLGEVLKEAGYHTMMSGKWHVGHKVESVYPYNRGFEQFYGMHSHVDSYFKVLSDAPLYTNDQLTISACDNPENVLHPDQEWYTTNVFTDYAIKFLQESKGLDKPFFLYLAYNSPHWPLEAIDEDIAKYRGSYTQGWDAVRQERFTRMKQMDIIDKSWQLSELDAPEWESLSENDRDNLDFRRAIYAAQIDRMDQNIGRVINQLKKQGDYENTLIMFLSDNGCSAEPESSMYGYEFLTNRVSNFQDWRTTSSRSASQGRAWANVSNTPFRFYKKWTHEGGIATPLIVHWPGAIKRPGALTHQPGHLVDIMATCVDVAQAKYPIQFHDSEITPMEGASLVPAFSGRTIHRIRPLFWEHEGNWAIRDEKWKLVCDGPSGSLELYDLDADRTELNNLESMYPGKVSQLIEKWEVWAKRANVLPWPYEPQWQGQ